MPDTARGLGVSNSYDPNENIDGGIRYLKQMLTMFDGDTTKALAAYNAGPGAVQKYNGVPPYDETQNYVQTILGSLGSSPLVQSTGTVARLDKENTQKVRTMLKGEQQPVAMEEATGWDGFQDGAYNSIIYGGARERYIALSNPYDIAWQPSQEDYQMLNKELNDPSTAYHIALNANSYPHMMAMLKTRKEDDARAQRVSKADWISWSSAAKGLGLLLDPINRIPIAGASSKAFTATKYLKMAGFNAALSTVDRALYEKITGKRQDLVMAALYGGLAGGLMPLGADVVSHTIKNLGLRTATKAMNKLKGFDDSPFDIEKIKKAANLEMPKGFKDLEIQQKFTNGSSFIVPKHVIAQIAENKGLILDEIPKVFSHDKYTFYAQEAFKTPKALENFIKTHSITDGKLQDLIDADAYQSIKSHIIASKNNNPSDTLKEALEKADDKDNIDEVAGHWLEAITKKNLQHPALTTTKKTLDNTMRRLGLTDGINDSQFERILTKKAKELQNKGYEVLKDGSAIIDGLKYAPDNPINPVNLEANRALFDPLRRTADFIADKLQGSSLFETPYLTLKNSKSKTLNNMAEVLVDNPLMLERNTAHIPISEQKHQMYTQLFDMTVDVSNKLKAVLMSEASGKIDDAMTLKVQTAIINEIDHRALGFKRNFMTPQREAYLKALSDYQEQMFEFGKEAGNLFGYKKNFLPRNYKPVYDGFYRFIDKDKLNQFLVDVGNKDEAIEILKDLGKASAQHFRETFFKENYEKALERKGLQILEDYKAKGSVGDALVKPLYSEEGLDEFIKNEAHKWAVGIIDQNHSTLESTKSTMYSLYNTRLPLNPAVELQTKYGKVSFNSLLRQYDFEQMLPMMTDKVSGELALFNYFNGSKKVNINAFGEEEVFTKSIEDMEKVIQNELAKQVSCGITTKRRAQKDLQEYRYVIDKLRGTHGKTPTIGDGLQNILSRLAYSTLGGNMGLNQLSELAGSIAYAGRQALYDIIPFLNNHTKELKYGKNKAELIEQTSKFMLGENIEEAMFKRGVSRDRIDFKAMKLNTPLTSTLETMDYAATVASNLTSKANGLTLFTNNMIKGARGASYADIFSWLEGKNTSILKDPFSSKKLRAAGIRPHNQKRFKELLNSYCTRDADGNIKTFDYAGLQSSHPIEYNQLYMLVRQHSMRSIQQITLGNSNRLSESHYFYKMLFQFKKFNLMTMQSQALRGLANHEIDDVMSYAWHLTLGGALATGIGVGRAYVKHKDDPKKRDEMIDFYTKPQNIMLHGFLRSPMVGLGIANDIYEVLSGSPIIRTTSSNTGYGKNIIQSPPDAAGRLLGQLPTVKTAANFIGLPADTVYKMLTPEQQVTQKELSNLLTLMPMSNFIPLIHLKNEMLKATGLPKENPKPKRQRRMSVE